MKIITTARLQLCTPRPEEVAASLCPMEQFAALVGPVAEDWPPLYWDEGAVKWLSEKSAGDIASGWYVWFVRLRSGELIGTAGFTGPTVDGVVEIRHGIVKTQWRKGYASEAVAALLAWASNDARVQRVRAHTLRGDPASSGVLLKNGFVLVGQSQDPSVGGDGIVDRYERECVAT